jgi:hypothetical protein
MERIEVLASKIKALSQTEDLHPIDVELMIDFTKMLYGELLELKSNMNFGERSTSGSLPANLTVIVENNLGDISQPIDLNANDTTETEEIITESHEPSFVKVPYEDIRKSIGFNDRYQFITELFSNNKDAYERVMDKISTCHTPQDAFDWLEEEIVPVFEWHEEDEAVQYFYTTVNDYFIGR